MHELQKQILDLANKDELAGKNLREIGLAIKENHLQKVKHHLSALINNNLLKMDSNGNYRLIDTEQDEESDFINIPIYGSANCGVATLYATDAIEGRLKISKSSFRQNNYDALMTLKAVGESMNKANIDGDNINHGDYLIIDTSDKSPRDGDYVLSIIDNMANIKRYTINQDKDEIRLISESTKKIAPIVATQSDNFLINGKVIKVIKSK